MGVVSLNRWTGILVCPRCRAKIAVDGATYRCPTQGCACARAPFPVIGGLPALVDFDESILSADRLVTTSAESLIDRSRPKRSALREALGRLATPPNRVAPRVVRELLALLGAEATGRPLVLVVGGGVVGSGLDQLYAAPVDLLSFDIYASPLTQLIADAHRIPVANGTVDAVVVHAVLEHVLEPWVVAGEIHRVLRPGGLIYAGTPFLQQVHEGPYDFTRFTESGHRYLFRDFELIDSGLVGGPGMQLLWSVDYFCRALFRSRRAGLVARRFVAWLPALDRTLDPSYAVDGASGVYFLGRRSERRITPAEIIDYYQGAQR